MAGYWGELVLPCSFLEEPARLGRLELELEGAVGEGGQLDLQGHVAADVGSDFIELLAEFHHIDPERTERLTHFGVGLGDSCEDAKVDGCWVGWGVPR